MTGVAGGTLVDVSRFFPVLFIHLALAMFMATETGEIAEVARVCVTGFAATPASTVRSREYRKVQSVVVGKVCVFPGVIGVTEEAFGRESGTAVFVVVVVLMTGYTIVLIRRSEDGAGCALAVAARAANLRVSPQEGKSVGIANVIECHVVRPR